MLNKLFVEIVKRNEREVMLCMKTLMLNEIFSKTPYLYESKVEKDVSLMESIYYEVSQNEFNIKDVEELFNLKFKGDVPDYLTEVYVNIHTVLEIMEKETFIPKEVTVEISWCGGFVKERRKLLLTEREELLSYVKGNISSVANV